MQLLNCNKDSVIKESPSVQMYLQLEDMLISGVVNSDVCIRYPELSIDDLSIQLTMFKRHKTYCNTAEAQSVM